MLFVARLNEDGVYSRLDLSQITLPHIVLLNSHNSVASTDPRVAFLRLGGDVQLAGLPGEDFEKGDAHEATRVGSFLGGVLRIRHWRVKG